MGEVAVVVGVQFGDEAKGKITDYLAADARYVVRTGGGPNAGHTIYLGEERIVLHQISSGVLRAGCTSISGPGMVIDPGGFLSELRELEERHLRKGEVIISDRAHVLLPIHRLEDLWEETVRQRLNPASAIGTTGRGIGPAFADRYGRWGLRFAEFIRPKLLDERLRLIYASKDHLPDRPPFEELEREMRRYADELAPMVRPTEPILWSAVDRGEPILLEGANGALLDIDFGTYPYVTSSHPTSAGALIGSGIAPAELDRIVGVTKAYATRVGAGPFPTEEKGEMGEYLRREGREQGATTGRPRRTGWLDLVLLRYTCRLNGLTSLAVTKVDVLGGLEEVPVATAYRLPDGTTLTDRPPVLADDLARVEPVYERLPGWPEFNHRLKDRLRREGARAVPSTLGRFLDFLTENTGVPVDYVSYGPERSETLSLDQGKAGASLRGVRAWSNA